MNTVDAPFPNLLPILIVDNNGPAGEELAEALCHAGFQADVATSHAAAQIAVHARCYGSLVAVTNPEVSADLDGLAALRKKVPRTWIVAISSTLRSEQRQVLFHHGADSILVAPFSLKDLTARLSALAWRERPP